DALEVNADGPVKGLFGHLQEILLVQNTSGGHQDVDAAKFTSYLIHHLFSRSGISDIECPGFRRAALLDDVLGDLRCILLVEVNDGDVGLMFAIELGDGCPDSTGSAGNHCYFSFELRSESHTFLLRLVWLAWPAHGLATIDDQLLAGDKGRVIRGQETDSACAFFRGAHTPPWDVAAGCFQALFAE